MQRVFLNLYTRKGCCLCEGLEQRLRGLQLNELVPQVELCVIDIDKKGVLESDRSRYNLEVPVLVLKLEATGQSVHLPRVSPRLTEKGLFVWLQKAIEKNLRIE